MDLRKFDTLNAVEIPHEFVVKDLDGVETDISFSVYGAGSKVYRKHYAKIESKENTAKKRGKELPAEEFNELLIDVMAHCMVGWKNVEEDGKQVEFSYDNAVDLLTRYPFFRDAVFNGLLDVRAFLQE